MIDQDEVIWTQIDQKIKIQELPKQLQNFTNKQLALNNIPSEKHASILIDFYTLELTTGEHAGVKIPFNDTFLAQLRELSIDEGYGSSDYKISNIYLKDSSLILTFLTDFRPLSGMIIIVTYKFEDGIWKPYSFVSGDC